MLGVIASDVVGGAATLAACGNRRACRNRRTRHRASMGSAKFTAGESV